jgi:hypothetical protein
MNYNNIIKKEYLYIFNIFIYMSLIKMAYIFYTNNLVIIFLSSLYLLGVLFNIFAITLILCNEIPINIIKGDITILLTSVGLLTLSLFLIKLI